MFQDVDIRFNLAQVEARCRQVMGCGFFTFWRPVIFLRISSNKKDGHFKCHFKFKYVENFGKMMIHQWFFELLVYPLFLTIFRQTHLGWSLSYHFLEFPLMESPRGLAMEFPGDIWTAFLFAIYEVVPFFVGWHGYGSKWPANCMIQCQTRPAS